MTGNPLLYLTILLLVISIQFILMGLLAELLVRTYHESQDRPTYVIKEILGVPKREGRRLGEPLESTGKGGDRK